MFRQNNRIWIGFFYILSEITPEFMINPQLNLGGNWGTSYSSALTPTFGQQMKDNRNKSLGLSLSVPIFNRFTTRNRVRTARLRHLNMSQINLLPVGFTFDSWKYLFMKGKIWMPFLISVFSTVLGVAIALLLNVLMAYPLSKTEFRPSKYIMLFVVFTMVFAAPKVPYFLTLRSYGLYNNYWVLILPHIMTAYNLIIVRTFFKQFPRELEEAAMIDGCGKFRILLQIVLPASKAVLATVGLFYGVTMWNQYEHPMMFIQNMNLFPYK